MNTTDKEIDLIGDAYKNYCKQNDEILGRSDLWTLTKQEFINKIKTDDEFAKKWGITIETKELSREERWDLYSNRFTTMKPHKFQKMLDGVWVESTEEEDMFEYDVFRIPKRAITITYNGQTQEKYE